MSVQWTISRGDLKKEASIGNKPYNEEKYNQLYAQIDRVCSIFKDKENVKTLTRKIVEEVMNIIEHNETWNTLKVRTEVNTSKSRFKAEIIYDGAEYFNPEENNIGNVVGSLDVFKDHTRNVKRDVNGEGSIEIRINIEVEQSC